MIITIGGLAVTAPLISAPVAGVTITGEGSTRTITGNEANVLALANSLIAAFIADPASNEPSRRAGRAILRETGAPIPWELTQAELAA